MKTAKEPKINCPTCGKEHVWDTANPFRPFCSERCKLIDLGAWASEEHAIPGEPSFPPEDSMDWDNYP